MIAAVRVAEVEPDAATPLLLEQIAALHAQQALADVLRQGLAAPEMPCRATVKVGEITISVRISRTCARPPAPCECHHRTPAHEFELSDLERNLMTALAADRLSAKVLMKRTGYASYSYVTAGIRGLMAKGLVVRVNGLVAAVKASASRQQERGHAMHHLNGHAPSMNGTAAPSVETVTAQEMVRLMASIAATMEQLASILDKLTGTNKQAALDVASEDAASSRRDVPLDALETTIMDSIGKEPVTVKSLMKQTGYSTYSYFCGGIRKLIAKGLLVRTNGMVKRRER